MRSGVPCSFLLQALCWNIDDLLLHLTYLISIETKIGLETLTFVLYSLMGWHPFK